MTIQVRALRPLFGDYGTVSQGQVFSVDERSARELERRRVVERVIAGTVMHPRSTMAFIPPERKAVAQVEAFRIPSGQPLVSCIMPTADRKTFVPGAVRSFLAQDYPNKELVILDDGKQAVRPLVPQDPRVRYSHSPEKRNVGEKRNLLCESAVGQVICHWDDDDRSAVTRISEQVRLMQRAQKPVVGFSSILFWSDDDREMYRYDGKADYAVGTSLCYLRAWWQEHRFPSLSVSEDNAFVKIAQGKIATEDGSTLIVAHVHGRSVSQKPLNAEEYKKVKYALPGWATR